MESVIQLKKDNRYKNGNIVKKDGVYRGNEATVRVERLSIPKGAPIELQLNPPISVGPALAKLLGAQF